MDRLTAMRTFVTVVEAGGFTRASNTLGIPKGRVSEHVKAEEARLGVKLIYRTTRAMSPTEEGRRYYERCKSILGDVEEMDDMLLGRNTRFRGTVHVDSLPVVLRSVIIPQLPSFASRYPEIVLRIRSSDRVSDLIEDGLDCAIRGGVLQDSSMIVRHVATIGMGLYASLSYLAARPAPATPMDLPAHCCIGWFNARTGNPVAWALARAGEQFTATPTPQLAFGDGESILQACLAGAGIGIAPPFAVVDHVRAGRLVPVLPEWEIDSWPLQIVYPARRHLPERVRCFIDWFSRIARESSALSYSPKDLAARSARQLTA